MGTMAINLEQNCLINELTQGKELANQLRNHLDPSSSNESRQFLVDKILCTYEKSLSLLNKSAFMVEPKPTINSVQSPNSLAHCSPAGSEQGSDQESKDHFCHKDLYKKRKTMPRWTEQVRVCTGSGLEGPLDDGYNWRKYGQKDILGAKFPRGYYRCTHRPSQGCLATKQVQRSDEDPTILEVTYRGRHTCIQSPNSSVPPPSSTVINSGPKNNSQQKQSKESVLNFGAEKEEIFPSFTFPCAATTESDNIENNIIFSDSILEENNFMSGFASSFMSPDNSGSNYFSMSPYNVSSFGVGHNVQSSESDHTETFSAPTSVTNSPIGDLDFSLVKVEFDSNFPFDNPEFFS